MEIKLNQKEAEEFFHTALCNGLGYMSGYGLDLTFEKADYEEARKKLESPCYEDVLLQILRDGKGLTMVDEECEGEYTRTITLADVHARVDKTPLRFLLQMVEENDDAETADVIIQTVFYEDIIFG
jgi:hypothetical protein